MFAMLAEQAGAQISTTVDLPANLAVRSPGNVNTVDGQYADPKVHLAIGDPGAGGFEILRTYKKNKPPITNWHYEIRRRGTSAGGWYFSVEGSDSSATFFSFSGDGPYAAKSLSMDDGLSTLERLVSGSNKYFVYTDGSGKLVRFLASVDGYNQYAEEIRHPNGIIYKFIYDFSGETRLRRIESNAGYEVIFEYFLPPNQLKISKICTINLSNTISPSAAICPTVDVVSANYTYSGDRISSYTDSLGEVYNITNSYVNATTPFQESFYKPGYAQPYLTNYYKWDTSGVFGLYVETQTFVGGYELKYTVGGTAYDTNKGARINRWTENGINQTNLLWGVYQAGPQYKPAFTPGPINITDPLSRQMKTEYNGAYTRIVSRTRPSGMREVYTYNGNASIIQRQINPPTGGAETPLIVGFTYDCTVAINCKKPATATNAGGAVTNYAYDATHGGLLSEMLPPPAAGGVRPLKLRTYVQKYAYVKNSSGTLVPSADAIWMLATETQCQTVTGGTTPVCDVEARQVMTTYQYGADGTANNLLVRGTEVTADSQTLRTCYSYNDLGRRISETKPSANLSVCP